MRTAAESTAESTSAVRGDGWIPASKKARRTPTTLSLSLIGTHSSAPRHAVRRRVDLRVEARVRGGVPGRDRAARSGRPSP